MKVPSRKPSRGEIYNKLHPKKVTGYTFLRTARWSRVEADKLIELKIARMLRARLVDEDHRA
jgi:hypothetical protein